MKIRIKTLEKEEILHLLPEQRELVAAYHADLFNQYALHFDIDTNSTARQMSMGMRIISFLGGAGALFWNPKSYLHKICTKPWTRPLQF
ncbi:hypothetical protein FO488_03480 [Geobacter sp. FeAm09]|uniref:hypothetical protein n=1 Tax=Geobacter sp. FeAm09 TaxID=2597769 RepID=UPI0011EF00C5|nr:hypothetical protein [Geobacter sp. FeAm09]QEM67306.1 hypothetical protein FO488_03480 [Geobacter sp. FeAm09]